MHSESRMWIWQKCLDLTEKKTKKTKSIPNNPVEQQEATTATFSSIV